MSSMSQHRGVWTLAAVVVLVIIGAATGRDRGSTRTDVVEQPQPSAITAERAEMIAEAELEKCRTDLACASEEAAYAAEIECGLQIERLARVAYEWNRGMMPMFSRSYWAVDHRGAITYVGDGIRFQNGFGTWIPHVYECTFDPSSGRVLAARAEPGRLPRVGADG